MIDPTVHADYQRASEPRYVELEAEADDLHQGELENQPTSAASRPSLVFRIIRGVISLIFLFGFVDFLKSF